MQLGTLRGRLFLPAVLALFTASGFAGLIYESIWRYKKGKTLSESLRTLEREQIDEIDESNIPGYQP